MLRKRLILSTWFLFREAALTGSLRTISEKYGVAPSTIKRRFDALEKSVGETLLERSPEGIKLTPKGLEYYRQVSQALSALDENSEKMPFERLYVNYDSRLPSHLVFRAASALIRQHPSLKVECRNAPSGSILENQPENSVCLSLTPEPSLGSLKFVLVGSQRYLEKREQIFSPKDLTKHQLIGLSGVPFVVGRKTFTPSLVLSEEESVIGAVRDGLGIGYLPKGEILNKGLRDGSFSMVLPAESEFTRWLKVKTSRQDLRLFFQAHIACS